MSELTRTELRRVADEFKSERDAAKSATLRAFDERDILLNENAVLRNERDALTERVEKLRSALAELLIAEKLDDDHPRLIRARSIANDALLAARVRHLRT